MLGEAHLDGCMPGLAAVAGIAKILMKATPRIDWTVPIGCDDRLVINWPEPFFAPKNTSTEFHVSGVS